MPGTPVVMDYRLWHRGLPNTGETDRYLLYTVFQKAETKKAMELTGGSKVILQRRRRVAGVVGSAPLLSRFYRRTRGRISRVACPARPPPAFRFNPRSRWGLLPRLGSGPGAAAAAGFFSAFACPSRFRQAVRDGWACDSSV